MEYFKSANTDLPTCLSDLSIVNKSGAEIITQSLNVLNQQNQYLMGLMTSIQRRGSINLVLGKNLKRSVDNFNDQDINIKVKKGVVYVSIYDKILFHSDSYQISNHAFGVIGKIGKIVNDHKELDILIEGHTDNVLISKEYISYNWDLSVKKVSSMVCLMQKKFGVLPSCMTAGIHFEYLPKTINETVEGRAKNLRTVIVILPKLEPLTVFQLFEPPITSINLKE